MKPDGTAWPARSPELPCVMARSSSVVRATSGNMTEVTGRWNLTQVAKERVSGESAMMIEVWVPVGGGTPENSTRPVGLSG